MLRTIHFRVVKEEYEIAGEPIPEAVWSDKAPDIHVERPSFRLIHGLPGSGKSKLIEWLKQYFEKVWQWTQGKQYAIVAPMNTMADNIGGTTIHSFGRIPFKDKRGVTIHPGKNTETTASIFADEPWHELRFVLLDEVEACGVSIFGKLEESLRANVPSSNSAYQALQKKDLQPDRVRSIAFAGVNMLCFGDFGNWIPLATPPSCRTRPEYKAVQSLIGPWPCFGHAKGRAGTICISKSGQARTESGS